MWVRGTSHNECTGSAIAIVDINVEGVSFKPDTQVQYDWLLTHLGHVLHVLDELLSFGLLKFRGIYLNSTLF